MNWWHTALNHPIEFGMQLFRSTPKASSKRGVEVYRDTAGASHLIGRLTQEEGEFVFRYDPAYSNEPISAFPKMKEYRSKFLWPFFAVRIPPLNREDIREILANKSIAPDQPLEILGEIAKFSVTNPYRLEIVGERPAADSQPEPQPEQQEQAP